MLKKIKKVLFEIEYPEEGKCYWCGKALEGNQRKFCSDKCNNYHYRFVEKFGRNPSYSKRVVRERFRNLYDKEYAKKRRIRRKSYQYRQSRNVQGKCLFCGRVSEEIHHINYDKSVTDEVDLCKGCHVKLHKILNRMKGGNINNE